MSDGKPDGDEAVVVECDLDEPPEKVWRALTEPDLVEAWLGRPGEAPGGEVERRVLDAEPYRRLRLGWRIDGGIDGGIDSEVSFELTPRPDGGTHLRLVHDGFRGVPAAANGNAPVTLRPDPMRMAA